MFTKNKRIVDPETLSFYRGLKCCLCGKSPSVACHIKTVKSGGHDLDFNLLAMCVFCHNYQHARGFYALSKRYPILLEILDEKGWKFNKHNKLELK